MTEPVRIEVDGDLPPAKSEARSLLAATHPHAGRVRRLLEATRVALGDRAPFVGPVRLEVEVRWPGGPGLPDATNLLGGIGDTLQREHPNVDLSHVGDLAGVHVFENDRQIEQVEYRQVRGAVGYSVVVSPLP